MNKLIALCGLVMLSTTTTPQEGFNEMACDSQEVAVNMTSMEEPNLAANAEVSAEPVAAYRLKTSTVWAVPVDLALDEIEYIEEETSFDLGFDTAEYLPEDFDPHKVYVNLDAITYIDEDMVDEDLGFDTSEYLPEDFNPYSYPVNVMSIDYIEEGEDEIDLGFDTAQYLPDGFDPHELYVDLDAIEYIEEDVWEIEYVKVDLGI